MGDFDDKDSNNTSDSDQSTGDQQRQSGGSPSLNRQQGGAMALQRGAGNAAAQDMMNGSNMTWRQRGNLMGEHFTAVARVSRTAFSARCCLEWG